jgi:hypothetical protein
MAKIKIVKKDGTATSYFWSDKDGTENTKKRVYKQTADGVKRMRDVRFNTETNRVRRRV